MFFFSEDAWLISEVNEPTIPRFWTMTDPVLLLYILRNKDVKLRYTESIECRSQRVFLEKRQSPPKPKVPTVWPVWGSKQSNCLETLSEQTRYLP